MATKNNDNPPSSNSPQYLGDEDGDCPRPEDEPTFLGDEPPPPGGTPAARIRRVEVTPWRFEAEGVRIKDKTTLILLAVAIPVIASTLTGGIVILLT
jgi:hypothetical protein